MALAKALHVSPAVFFQFDREESDEKALRRKMDALLQKSNPRQLQQAYRLLRALLEP